MALFKIPDIDRLKHQRLYKGKSPPWKDTFREKCFQRLRSSRSRLVDQFRGLKKDNETDQIDVLMEVEWKSLCDEQDSLPGLFKGDVTDKALDDIEVNEIISFMDQVQKELVEEEKRILAEHYANFEASSLQSTIDWLEQEEVICPICQKSPLFQNKSVIFCKCGMRIDTEQDGLTLTHLKNQLHQGLDIHNNNCCSTPAFSLITLTDITNLAITCNVCYFMYIVI